VMMVAGGVVSVADLPHTIRAAYLSGAPKRPDAVRPAGPPSPVSRIDREDARLMDVVNRSRTMAAAAAELGITRSTLYRRMERFGLQPRRVIGRK